MKVLAKGERYDEYDGKALAGDAEVEWVAFVALVDMSAHALDNQHTNRGAKSLSSHEHTPAQSAVFDSLGQQSLIHSKHGRGRDIQHEEAKQHPKRLWVVTGVDVVLCGDLGDKYDEQYQKHYVHDQDKLPNFQLVYVQAKKHYRYQHNQVTHNKYDAQSVCQKVFRIIILCIGLPENQSAILLRALEDHDLAAERRACQDNRLLYHYLLQELFGYLYALVFLASVLQCCFVWLV